MTFMKQSVIIQKPLEEVFAAAIDFSNSPEVMDAVVDVELLSEGLCVRVSFQGDEVDQRKENPGGYRSNGLRKE